MEEKVPTKINFPGKFLRITIDSTTHTSARHFETFDFSFKRPALAENHQKKDQKHSLSSTQKDNSDFT